MTDNYVQTAEPVVALAPTDCLRELADEAVLFIGRLPGPISRVELTRGDCRVQVEWAQTHSSDPRSGPVGEVTPKIALGSIPPRAAHEGEPALPAGHVQVKAPLVGTFYQATGPGAPPLVEVGQIVEIGQQLAIIEAMKLMNPINADCRGRVSAAHVTDGASVEFDQPLFDLEPLGEV